MISAYCTNLSERCRVLQSVTQQEVVIVEDFTSNKHNLRRKLVNKYSLEL